MRLVHFFVSCLLLKEELGEHYCYVASKISSFMNRFMHDAEWNCGQILEYFESETIPGASTCKLIIDDRIVRGDTLSAYHFVDYLEQKALFYGSVDYLSRSYIKIGQYTDDEEIEKVEHAKLRNFLYFHNALRLKSEGNAEKSAAFVAKIGDADIKNLLNQWNPPPL